jgi:hypothetical protein
VINEERFWESAIQEAVRNDPPPDVTARVLAGLAEPEPAPKPVDAPRGRLRLLRILAEVAVAAAVVFAIGWLTGILRTPEESGTAEPRNVAAAPGAEYEFNQGVIELNVGWLLVSTGAPDVLCNGSVLSQVDGQVLVHASGVPTRGQAEAVVGWLQANKLEIDMVGDMKNWARGTVMAALVLSGSAMLDGQKIEGPQPAPVATTEWHVVRSVMDIDNLPKGARFINADRLNAAHLDFLAEVESIEAISMRWAEELRPDHLQSLKALKNLQWLDIRGAFWKEGAAPDSLVELTALKRLGMDLVPQGVVPEEFPYNTVTLPVLKQLSERGVEIELGEWNPRSQEALQNVLDDLPTLRGIVVMEADVGEMKMLAGHKGLKSIELVAYSGGQIGLAYLRRKASLEELSISSWGSSLSLDEVHQISKMELRFLRIDMNLSDSPEQTFGLLAGMKNLRELELSSLGLSREGQPAFAQFKGMQTLDRLRVADDEHGYAFMVAQLVPTRRLELTNFYISALSDVPEVMRQGDARNELQEVRFDVNGALFYTEGMSDDHLATLKSYPNLKRIEIRRGGFEDPSNGDQCVNWLKRSLPGVEVVITP